MLEFNGSVAWCGAAWSENIWSNDALKDAPGSGVLTWKARCHYNRTIMTIIEEIIETAQELARLDMRAEQLRSKLEKLKAKVGQGPDPAGTPSRARPNTKGKPPTSAAGRIVAMLRGSPGKVFSVAEIVAAIGGQATSVRSTLSRLASEERIQKTARGSYLWAEK